MKILLITPDDIFENNGGGNLYTNQFINTLKESHDVFIVALTSSESVNIHQCKDYKNLCCERNKLLARIRSIVSLQPSCYWEFDRRLIVNEIKKIARQHEFDVVVFNHRRTNWLMKSIKAMLNIPCVYMSQNAEKEVLESVSENYTNIFLKWLSYLELKKAMRYEAYALRHSSHVTAITRKDIELMRKIEDTDKYSTVSAWVEIPENNVNVKSINKLTIIGSFRWLPKKNNALWIANEIFPEILTFYPEIKLNIVGFEADNLVHETENMKSIHVFSNVDSTKEFFETPSIFLVPERQKGGLKIKTIEAASFGLPIVSTSEGISGTGLIDNIDVLVADSKEKFIEKILILIKSAELREKIGSNARKKVEKDFSQEKIQNNWLSVYNRILKEHVLKNENIKN